MTLPLNPHVVAVSEPPIVAARAWLDEPAKPGRPALLDLAQAVPSYPPDPALREAMAAAALEEETAFYTPILGLPALRDRFAASLARTYAGDIGAADVAITAGGNHAFCMALSALAGPGDEVLLAHPCYFNHDMWCGMQGVTAVPLPCRVGPSGVAPEVSDAAALIGPRTRAIILVTPNNPTGTVYEPERLAAFFELAEDRNIALIVDETYKDFLPGDAPPHGLFGNPAWRDRFIFLYSFSKAYSLTGYRVGGLAAGPAIMEAIGKIADTVTICPSHIGQRAALFGLDRMAAWKRARRDDMAARAETLARVMAGDPGGFRMVSSGAFFAYLAHPYPEAGAEAVARALVRDQGVFTLPGPIFGVGQEAFLRAAFANVDDAGIRALADRLAAFRGP
jgi:aspartate/methionine/tyrosine aminotransferase